MRHRQLSSFVFYLVFFMTMGISGCVDLSGGRAFDKKPLPDTLQSKGEKKRTQKKTKKVIGMSVSHQYHGQVSTMLGGLGIFSTGMRTLSQTVEEECHVPAPSDMWYNAGNVTRSIVASWRKHHYPIILVGHSLGANEQIKVARNLNKLGITVDLLVTVDAVSQSIVPPNVLHAMNFYKPGFVPMFSGLRLKAVKPEETCIDNINVTELKGIEVNHFTIDKDPIVQTMIMDEVKKVLSNANKANG